MGTINELEIAAKAVHKVGIVSVPTETIFKLISVVRWAQDVTVCGTPSKDPTLGDGWYVEPHSIRELRNALEALDKV